MTRNRIIQNNEKVNHHWLERLDIDIKMDYNKKKHRCGVRKMGIPTNIRTLLSGRVVEWARMEILSHPGADRSISMEGLKNYRAVSRRYRNRRIGEFLKELHLTEGRNTGFQKIIRALKANGSPMPTFETDDARSYFLTTIGIHPAFTVSNDSVNDSVNDTVSDQLSENEQRILAIIRENGDLSISAMAEMLGISYSTVSRALKGLKGKNWIRRDGSDKRGRWMVAR